MATASFLLVMAAAAMPPVRATAGLAASTDGREAPGPSSVILDVPPASKPSTSPTSTPISPPASTTAASTPRGLATPWPVTAAPSATTTDASAGSEQRRGQQALARLSYPWQQLGYTIAFLPGRPDTMGHGMHDQRRIEVYVRADESDALLTHVVTHEIGHAVDYLWHTPARDRLWLTLRGVNPNIGWAPCAFCSDFGSPSGDFAETFALWQLGDAAQYRSRLAGPPPQAVMAELSKRFFP